MDSTPFELEDSASSKQLLVQESLERYTEQLYAKSEQPANTEVSVNSATAAALSNAVEDVCEQVVDKLARGMAAEDTVAVHAASTRIVAADIDSAENFAEIVSAFDTRGAVATVLQKILSVSYFGSEHVVNAYKKNDVKIDSLWDVLDVTVNSCKPRSDYCVAVNVKVAVDELVRMRSVVEKKKKRDAAVRAFNEWAESFDPRTTRPTAGHEDGPTSKKQKHDEAATETHAL